MTDWTDPRTWNIGELVTKAIMDTHIRDNLKHLKELVTLAIPIAGRQGGSATDWSIGSTSVNFTPASAKIQVGRTGLVSTTTADGSFYKGTVTITFPVAFAQPPLVFATLSPSSLNANLRTVVVSSPSTTQVTLTVYSDASISVAAVNWMAIGA